MDGMMAAPPYRDSESFDVSAQGHDFSFYPAGGDRRRALLDLIGQARRTLYVFYYLFADDDDGAAVRDALAAAARGGLEVHLMVDGFGTATPPAFFDPIVEAGGSFAVFNARRSVRYLIRNHQKMVIADGERALVGGFNVSRHYFAPPEDNGWNDLGVEVRGPVVADLARWYGQLAAWTRDDKAQFRAIRRLVREWHPGDGPVRLLLGGPTRVPSSWARNVRRDLARGSRLDLVMAYFSPPHSMRRLMGRIGRSGAARLVMAARSDNTTTIGAARALYGRLLKAGVKIFEFLPCKLHTKLLVIDDAVYIGSANFDMRSIRLNLELMLRIEDAGLAAAVRGLIDGLAGASEEITPALHRSRRTWFNRIRWRLSWFLVHVLDYTITRRLNLGPGRSAGS